MKKNVLKSIVLFGGILFLAASCVKEIESKNDTYRPAGSPIVFSAATGYDNGVATRTTYSGETVTLSGYSNPFERIDWVSGDKIKVCYFNGGAAAVYTVGSPTADGEKSTADISSQSSMAWAGGTDDHVFYAMYPDATSDSGHGTNSSASLEVSPNGAFVSGLIPAAQTVYQKATGSKVYDADMVFGYLVSKKTISANSAESAVELPFRPATTTFQFQFKTESGSAAVTSFEMTSATSNLAGNFSFNMLTGADADQRGSASWGEVTVTNASKTITVSFDQAATITADAALDFTVFALPIDITDVTLKFNFTDNTSKTLALKRNDVFDTFTAGKKYIITNGHVPGNSEWVYTLTEVDTEGNPIAVTNLVVNTPATGHGGHIGHYPEQSLTKPFKSYKTKVDDDTDNVLVNVKIEYSPANEDGTCANNWTETLPSWLTSYAVTSQPAADAPTDTWMSQADFTEVTCNMSVEFNEIESSKQRIQALSARSSFTENKPQDLALYEIDKLNVGPRSDGKPKTANCYVVDRKGWYMFPLVYGNAIDWTWAPTNGWNTSSWRDNDTGDHTFSKYRLAHFQNYLAGWISSPYILDDVNLTAGDVEAVIVWEDVDASAPFILPDDLQVVVPTTTMTNAVYYEEDGATAKTVPYIKFRVNENIAQGNALIALREKTGDKRIIWSWHIWVSDLDMGTLTVPLHAGAIVASNDMMKYNLGWCDMRIGRKYSYAPRVWYVKISQTEAGSTAAPLVFKLAESLDPYYTITMSTGTYYQLLRKDPFLPGMSYEGLCWGDNVTSAPTYDNVELNKAPHTPHSQRYLNKPVYAPEYPVVTGLDMVNSVSPTSAQNDMRHVIQNPYIYYKHSDVTTMNWLYDKRPYNMWSMYQWIRGFNNSNLEWNANGYEIDYSPDYRYDLIVVKTIYDPCPPGFSVPNYTAFTGFTNTGTDLQWRDTGGQMHFDFAQWLPEDAEKYFDIELYGDYRWYFNTTAGTKTICIPGHGYRSEGKVAALFGGMYYPTVQKKGDRYVVCLSGWGPVGAGNSRASAYGVRAIKEQPRGAASQSAVIDGQGTDGYYKPGDLNNNWQ